MRVISQYPSDGRRTLYAGYADFLAMPEGNRGTVSGDSCGTEKRFVKEDRI